MNFLMLKKHCHNVLNQEVLLFFCAVVCMLRRYLVDAAAAAASVAVCSHCIARSLPLPIAQSLKKVGTEGWGVSGGFTGSGSQFLHVEMVFPEVVFVIGSR